MNLADAVRTASLKLEATSDSAQLDAGLLLCHVLDCPRSFVLSHPETALTTEQQQAFDSLIARRVQGEPVAYLIGSKAFWSLDLKVTPDVLIPRPETETLVEAALSRVPTHDAVRVLDMGTGSGAIALAIARERPHAHVTAVDILDAAVAVARDNARLHCIANAVFYESNGFAALEGQQFDMIVSNPPYIAAGDPHLPPLRFEPQTALVAGAYGLEMLRAIIREAPKYLLPHGWLLLEHGADQGNVVHELLSQAGFGEIETLPDLAGLPRVSLGQKSYVR